MFNAYEPFTPEAFKRATGLDASDNEAIYLRWVNTNINYANYQCMKEMVRSLHEMKSLLTANERERKIIASEIKGFKKLSTPFNKNPK